MTTEYLPEVINHEVMLADESRIDTVIKQSAVIRRLVKEAMIEGTDYGTIPGCGNKPTLLLPGAQKIGMLFNARPEVIREVKDLGDGHREYNIQVKLVHRGTGSVIGEGVGCASTMENKYKNRPTTADLWNTVYKIAYKRAFVCAVLYTGAAGDLFTQDLEDIADNRAVEVAAGPLPGARTPHPSAPKAASAVKDFPQGDEKYKAFSYKVFFPREREDLQAAVRSVKAWGEKQGNKFYWFLTYKKMAALDPKIKAELLTMCVTDPLLGVNPAPAVEVAPGNTAYQEFMGDTEAPMPGDDDIPF